MMARGVSRRAYTDASRIDESVARITDDPRALDQFVQAWDGETVFGETWKIVSKISSENLDEYPKMCLL
ncbi:hypothetical protein PM082_019973 [Marasmius tenuissimus]|nr:hypothetical protein PM082_019973 [Marasmius tenuissimus]